MNKEYLHKVLDKLVSETRIDYDQEKAYPPFLPHFPHLSFYPYLSFSSGFLFVPPSLPSFSPFSSFLTHNKEVYGLTEDEVIYVWKEYKNIMSGKIKNKPLNESTEDNALNKIVDQLVSETRIDYDRKVIETSSSFSFLYYSHLSSSIPLSSFAKHCKEVYGLTVKETRYVWGKYINIIKDKIKKG